MQSPLISCIVPVYNGKRYLKEAIDSILAQTYRPLEIIVADDGSTDGTASVVANYGNRVRCLWQPNAGPAAARNLGVRAAQGKFVAFLDSDDVWHPEKLSRQMARFQARPELGLCVTHVQNFWIPELAKEAERFRNHRISQPMPGYVTQALLAKRTLFDTVGLFNTTLQHGDVKDWLLRAAEHDAKMKLLPEVLVYRRMHRSNYSRQMSASFSDHLRIVKLSLDRRRRRNVDMPQTYKFPSSKIAR